MFGEKSASKNEYSTITRERELDGDDDDEDMKTNKTTYYSPPYANLKN